MSWSLYLILFLNTAFAQVEEAGWFTHLQGSLGGESRCTPASIAEVQQLDCNINNYNFRGDVSQFPDQADHLAEEIFFQSITERSHNSSRCHLDALNSYATNQAEHERFNQWSLSAFRVIEDELRYYVQRKAELKSEIAARRMTFDKMDYSRAQVLSRQRVMELESEVYNLNLAIKSLSAKVPLGNHKDVSESLEDLVKRDPVSDETFLRKYSDELSGLRRSIRRSVEYFDRNRNSNGTYVVDKDMKISFANSGQVDAAFESMNDREAFSDGLQCRIDSRYRKGHQITEMFKMIALAGATILAAEVVIPIRAGAAALSAASAAARLTYLGAEFSLLALNGAVAAAVIQDVVRSCNGPTVLMSGQSAPNNTCNPRGRLNGMLQEASNAECAANILFAAAPGLMQARRGYLALKNTRMASQAIEAPIITVEEIVVTAPRRSRAASSGSGDVATASGSRGSGSTVRPSRGAAGRAEPPVAGRADAETTSTGGVGATARTTQTREQFSDEYVNRTYASSTQNQRWIDVAGDTPSGTSMRFFDVENAAMKHLNDTLLDKNLVTSLTNLHKEMLSEGMETLIRRYPTVEFLPYSDFKAMRYALRPRPPATQLPAGLEDDLAQLFTTTNERFASRLSASGLTPAGENPSTWFRSGFASSADEATLTSRYARSDGADANRMRRFSDDDLRQNLENIRSEGERYRSGLQTSLASSGLMEPSSVAGKMIPRREVFDAARKTKNTDELREFIRRTTGQEVTVQQAEDIRRYTNLVDEFSPGIHVAQREVASLADSPAGGFSIDFAGLGSFNGQATADALANSTNIRNAVLNARNSERRVTDLFRERKDRVESTVREVLARHRIQADIVASGDDMVVRPTTAIPTEVRREIAEALSREIDPASIRMSHVGDNIASGNERMIMATLGEACEKWIRKAAQGVVSASTLSQTLMLVEVSGTSSTNFSTNLVLGEGRTPISAADRASLQRISGQAVQAGCR
ncbi:hypothetical protein [Pseudobdellovibrio exovorus]|uniref:Uncharacterized protein n=1 Tax=Pseudobdellovibrio exovorus JSS TaxID=1184267 RepID=M4VEG0_9BACT|nr:hypothetical protein [Pseudobdellovibrio exovorus]AGH96421.1 hypothetical protein A11Q_2205 [Pseudobdellovibrio exovorus JSS]